jgi:hypothetical protein
MEKEYEYRMVFIFVHFQQRRESAQPASAFVSLYSSENQAFCSSSTTHLQSIRVAISTKVKQPKKQQHHGRQHECEQIERHPMLSPHPATDRLCQHPITESSPVPDESFQLQLLFDRRHHALVVPSPPSPVTLLPSQTVPSTSSIAIQ